MSTIPTAAAEFSITRTFDAARELVWRAWTEESGEKFPTGGVFLEVEPIVRLVFTWGEPDAPLEAAPVITLTFTAQGTERTELVFHLRGFEGKAGDGFVYDGWDEALTNFGRHLAGEQLS